MADEELVGAAPVAAPVVDVAPVVDSAPVAESTPTPVAETPAAPEVKAEEPAAPAPSLLSEVGETPVEPVADATLVPVGQPLEYTDLKVPDGFELDQEQFKDYADIFGKANVPKDVVEAVVAKYVDTVKRGQELQQQYWDKTRTGWVDKGKSDPEIGGNRWGTTLEDAKYSIERFGGNAQQIAELRQALGFTGAGDHPAVVRFFAKVGAALREGKPVQVPTQPVKASSTMSRAQRLYGGQN